MFDPYYGVNDYDGDGDIFKTENIDALKAYVYRSTMQRGVHIVMADGVRSILIEETKKTSRIIENFVGIFCRRTRKYSRNFK